MRGLKSGSAGRCGEARVMRSVARDILARGKNETYWSIGYRTARIAYAVKYVAFPMVFLFFFVVCPLWLYEPRIFSSDMLSQMSEWQVSQFAAKFPVVLLVLFLPASLFVAMVVVGQIKRFHDMNLSAWMCVLNAVPFAPVFITLALCVLPGTKGPNRFGDPPGER